MEQKRTAPRAQKTQPLTYREWKRRKQLRLARNWVLFLAGCALVVFLLTKGILWLLPHLHGADGPQTFAASAYDSTGYFFDADDARLVLVNANLPFDEEPSPTLDAADEAGTQLEAEAAQQYRSMAEAAQADGITLTLVTGYQDADTRTAAYEAQKQTYLARHKSEEEASARAAAILPEADATSTAPAMRPTSSARTTPPRTPALPIPAPTSGSRPTPPSTALSCATRRTGRPSPGWCSSRGTGGMWGWKTPWPSVPAA